MTMRHRLVAAELRRPWLVANVVAFAVGGGLDGGVLRFLGQPFCGTETSAIEAAYLQARSRTTTP